MSEFVQTLSTKDRVDLDTQSFVLQHHPTTDIAGTLSPGDHGGGFNGQDAYVGNLVPVSMSQE